MKILLKILLVAMVYFVGSGGIPGNVLVAAAEMKIAVVDLNLAMNLSDSGKRSKNLLMASKTQKESELKVKDENLKKMAEEIQNNILLTDSAREQKKKEFQRKSNELRAEIDQAQRDLQGRERKVMETIITQIRGVINMIAKREKYDLVLDKGAAQVILFSTFKMVDITDQVIKQFNQTKP